MNPIAPVGLDAQAWAVINDAVMGGISSAAVRNVEGALRFEGEVRREFNGGFASARRPYAPGAALAALRVTARGDGNRYRLTVFTRNPATGERQPFLYYAVFATADAQPTASELPLPGFRASLRGRAVPQAPPLRGEDIVGVGLMITKAEHAAGRGPFRLDLLGVEAVPGG